MSLGTRPMGHLTGGDEKRAHSALLASPESSIRQSDTAPYQFLLKGPAAGDFQWIPHLLSARKAGDERSKMDLALKKNNPTSISLFTSKTQELFLNKTFHFELTSDAQNHSKNSRRVPWHIHLPLMRTSYVITVCDQTQEIITGAILLASMIGLSQMSLVECHQCPFTGPGSNPRPHLELTCPGSWSSPPVHHSLFFLTLTLLKSAGQFFVE